MRLNINGNICKRAVRNCCLCCRVWWCSCDWHSRYRRSLTGAELLLLPDDAVACSGVLARRSATAVVVDAVAMRIHTVHVQAQISSSANDGTAPDFGSCDWTLAGPPVLAAGWWMSLFIVVVVPVGQPLPGPLLLL